MAGPALLLLLLLLLLATELQNMGSPAAPLAVQNSVPSGSCHDAHDRNMTPHLLANPVECQASEYRDEHGKCAPCRECGPGLELSKECGYGEGGASQCTPCPPRRFKDGWGHHGCKPCLSCSLIHRIQKSPCAATSDAVCGACFPGFYSKTQIGGLQGLECVPCTKQTPPSEPQCHSRVPPEKAEDLARPAFGPALPVLTSSALALLVLASLLSLLCCQRFWKSQCQRVLLPRRGVSGQREMLQAAAEPAGFPPDHPQHHHEQRPDPCGLSMKSFSPCHGSLEGPVGAVRFFCEGKGLQLHLPTPQADWDFSKLIAASPKAPQARLTLETRPLLRNSGCSDSSAGGSSFTQLRQDSAADTDDPAPLPSCATEMQPHWPHTPVECTELELDLQNFSGRAEQLQRDGAEKRGTRRTLRGRTELAAARCGDPAVEEAGLSCSSFRNPTAESGEQLGSGTGGCFSGPEEEGPPQR